MQVVRTLIVDDEPLGRERLRTLLAPDARIEVIGECRDGREAVDAIRRLDPDLVLLDIQMPELDGFGVLEEIGASSLPEVIFVTAYERYAIRAFEVNALDYLLKPVDPERLAAALDRSIEELSRRDAHEVDDRLIRLVHAVSGARAFPSRIVVHTEGAAFFLPVREIDWVEAAGNYVRIHANVQTHLLRQPLKELEARLDPEQFVRVHRSAIVNIDSVARVESWFRGEYRIELRDGTRLTSSRAHGNAFRAMMEK